MCDLDRPASVSLICMTEQSPWAWGRSRRRIFTSPIKDILSAVFVAGATGFYRYMAGDPGLRIAGTVSLITVGAAFALPQLETLFWFLARKWILFDAAQAEIAELKGRLGEGAAKA